tara:strand:- start:337 stop:579 length:243 start_codon:yes stop_codon:yes gene_type:complete
MSSSLVRVALNALRNQKPVLVPSSYSNTYSVVEVNNSLHTAWQIYNKECKECKSNNQTSGSDANKGSEYATPHMFLKQKL